MSSSIANSNISRSNWRSQREGDRILEAQLAVAGGVDVPGSGGLEEAGEPRPTEDEGGERVLHFGGGSIDTFRGWGLEFVVVVVVVSSEMARIGDGLSEQLQNFLGELGTSRGLDDHSFVVLWLAYKVPIGQKGPKKSMTKGICGV